MGMEKRQPSHPVLALFFMCLPPISPSAVPAGVFSCAEGEEKSRGLAGSAMGIVGLETAFPALYTYLVKPGILSLDRLMELMVYNPRKRFHIPLGEDYTVWELGKRVTVDPEQFLSKGRATPFAGRELYGVCRLTVCGGKVVYRNEE